MTGKSQQKGASFMGGLLVLVMMAFIGLMVLQISPVYMDSLAVKRIMDSAVEQSQGEYAGRSKVRDYLTKQLSMNNIDYLKIDDFSMDQDRDGGLVLGLKHRESRRLFANFYLTVAYDHRSD